MSARQLLADTLGPLPNVSVVTVPSCSAHVSASGYNTQAATSFDLESVPYYTNQIKKAIPGFVFAVLCWLAAVAFLLWLLTLCCRRVYWRNWKSRDGIKDVDGNRLQNRRRSTIPLMLGILFLTAGVLGVGAWGIEAGIHETNGAVGQFFGIVAGFQVALANISSQANVLTSTASEVEVSLQSALTVLQSPTSATLDLYLQSQGYDVTTLESQVQAAQAAVQSAISDANTALNGLTGAQSTLIQVQGYNRTAHNVNSIYRPLAIALLFGLIMLASLLVCVAACIGHTPRLTAFLLLILWIFSGAILFIGTGVVQVPLQVSKDTCLYAETYIARVVARDNAGNTAKLAQIDTGLDYYAGKTTLTPAEAFTGVFGISLSTLSNFSSDAQSWSCIAFTSVFGISLSTLSNFSSDAQVEQLLSDLRNPNSNVYKQLQSDALIDATDKANILALAGRVDNTTAQIPDLEDATSNAAITPQYVQAKQLICCTLVNTLNQVWIALTACGAAAGALAVLATATEVLAVGRTNQAHEKDNQEYVRYPVAAHAHGGTGPRGALLQPQNLSASY